MGSVRCHFYVSKVRWKDSSEIVNAYIYFIGSGQSIASLFFYKFTLARYWSNIRLCLLSQMTSKKNWTDLVEYINKFKIKDWVSLFFIRLVLKLLSSSIQYNLRDWEIYDILKLKGFRSCSVWLRTVYEWYSKPFYIPIYSLINWAPLKIYDFLSW